MVASPPRPGRRAAAAASPNTKLVCFRLGSWRYALGVEEIQGLFSSVPLIPNTEEGYSGLVQLAQGRVPVIDLRRCSASDTTILPTVALVENQGETLGLVFDLADEVIPVHGRGLLNTDLECSPLPARARTVTRYGDVFWLNVSELINTEIC
ncbi:chemotaxis protein CheW [bacterium]|nr:chemotaxis protein CheW [bacterium]